MKSNNSIINFLFLIFISAFLLSAYQPPAYCQDSDDEEDTQGKLEHEVLYEKYKNAPDGSEEKDELYKQYLKSYSEYQKNTSGKKNSDSEKINKNSSEKDRLNEWKSKYSKDKNPTDTKADKNSGSKRQKTYQYGDDVKNSRAKADEAYEKYKNAPDGSEEKEQYYKEYQKAYKEYLSSYSESRKLETGTAAESDEDDVLISKPKEKKGGNVKNAPVNKLNAPVPGVSYLVDTPATPVPKVEAGGGGGGYFKKVFKKAELATEKLIGAQTCAALELVYGVNKDPALNEKLNRVAQRIAAASDRRDLDYKFKILNMSDVNAFAVPGGTIYVTKAMLDFVSSDSELAFVLGHEMGHQVGKHSLKAIERTMLIEYFIKKSKAGVIKNNQQALEIANVFMGLKYSRDNEFQADQYGFKYASFTGYNPYGGVGFFQKLKAKYETTKTPAFLTLFQTHPPTSDRLGRVNDMANSFSQTHTEWRSYAPQLK